MEQNVIQINGGITMNVDTCVKNVIYMKKIVWNPYTCSWKIFSKDYEWFSNYMWYEIIE